MTGFPYFSLFQLFGSKLSKFVYFRVKCAFGLAFTCKEHKFSNALNVVIYLLFFLGDSWCWRLNFRFVCSDCDRGDRGGRDVVFADTPEVYWCLQLYKNRQTSQAWEKKKKYDKFGKGKKNRNTYIQWTWINFVYIVFERPCLWLLPNFSWRRTQKLLGPVWECRLRIKCFRLQTLVFVIQLIVPTHTNFLREKSFGKYGNQKARNFMNRSNQEFNFCFQDKMNRQTKLSKINLKFWEKTKKQNII